MKKADFKLIHEVAQVVPKMMKMSDSMFIAVICSSISTYAVEHDIDIHELLGRVMINLLCDELEFEDENDDDKE